MIISVNAQDVYRPGIDDVIRVFYPGCSIKTAGTGEQAELKLYVEIDVQAFRLRALATLEAGNLALQHQEQTTVTQGFEKNEARRLARLAVYHLLEKLTGKRPSPWGIMTGIRPTKVVHRLFDQGLTASEVKTRLTSEFALTGDKADLVTGIALHQRPYLPLKPGRERQIGVYVGIPFCPSRCLYCSFPSYPRDKYKRWIDPFVEALLHEIEAAGNAVKDNSLAVRCIYLGGGTPTCLGPDRLAAVLETLNRNLRGAETSEFTVEGGRPETLTPEILGICREAGVDRLSINPQTMHEKTLRAIGRNHSVDDVFRAMESARKTGFKTINMDIIAGLPGETTADLRDTLRQIASLRPENLSVHTLAIKKASRLRWEVEKHPMPTAGETAGMVEESRNYAARMGMIPYYMYRQKNTLGQQENTGYTLPGHDCLYNIMIMEERHSIVGLGAGAGSKYLLPDGLLVNRYNPRDPWLYIERLPEIIHKKQTGLAALNPKGTALSPKL